MATPMLFPLRKSALTLYPNPPCKLAPRCQLPIRRALSKRPRHRRFRRFSCRLGQCAAAAGADSPAWPGATPIPHPPEDDLMASIFTRRNSQGRKRSRPASRNAYRPRLELLETRLAPSINPATPFELDGNAVTATTHDWDQVFADAGS